MPKINECWRLLNNLWQKSLLVYWQYLTKLVAMLDDFFLWFVHEFNTLRGLKITEKPIIAQYFQKYWISFYFMEICRKENLSLVNTYSWEFFVRIVVSCSQRKCSVLFIGTEKKKSSCGNMLVILLEIIISDIMMDSLFWIWMSSIWQLTLKISILYPMGGKYEDYLWWAYCVTLSLPYVGVNLKEIKWGFSVHGDRILDALIIHNYKSKLTIK